MSIVQLRKEQVQFRRPYFIHDQVCRNPIHKLLIRPSGHHLIQHAYRALERHLGGELARNGGNLVIFREDNNASLRLPLQASGDAVG